MKVPLSPISWVIRSEGFPTHFESGAFALITTLQSLVCNGGIAMYLPERTQANVCPGSSDVVPPKLDPIEESDGGVHRADSCSRNGLSISLSCDVRLDKARLPFLKYPSVRFRLMSSLFRANTQRQVYVSFLREIRKPALRSFYLHREGNFSVPYLPTG